MAEKKVSLKKTVYFVIVLCAVCSLVSGALVYAVSPSNYLTITSGPYPGAENFTVFVDDGTYYAKNSYGQISYTGTNAATVINDAIEETYDNGGGEVKITGSITLTETIIIKSFVWLVGEATLKNSRITTETDINMIQMESYSGICNLDLRAYGETFTHSIVSLDDNYGAQIVDCVIRDCFIWRSMTKTTGGIGINLTSSTATRGITNCKFEDLTISSRLNCSIFLNELSTGWINSNVFTNVLMIGCPYGFIMSKGGSGDLSHNMLTNVCYQTLTYETLAFSITSWGNVLDKCNIYDMTDTNTGIQMQSGAIFTRISDCLLDGIYSDSGVVTRMTGTLSLYGGAFKYSETAGTVYFNGNTSVTITNSMIAPPNVLDINFNSTAYGSYTWSHDGSTLTITVANSGNYKAEIRTQINV